MGGGGYAGYSVAICGVWRSYEGKGLAFQSGCRVATGTRIACLLVAMWVTGGFDSRPLTVRITERSSV